MIAVLAWPDVVASASDSFPNYLPVEVFIDHYQATCTGTLSTRDNFFVSQNDGTSAAGRVDGPRGAFAEARAGALALAVGDKLGETAGPQSVVRLAGIGAQAAAQGGFGGETIYD